MILKAIFNPYIKTSQNFPSKWHNIREVSKLILGVRGMQTELAI